MWAATFCSPAVRLPRSARRSSNPMIVSEIERGKIGGERGFIFETAQIQDLRAIFEATDNRNGEAAKRSGKSVERTARAARGTRPNRQAGARYGLKRQRAGAYL